MIIISLDSIGQFSDSLLNVSSKDTLFWNQIFEKLNQENNPKATLLLSEVKGIVSKQTLEAERLNNDSCLNAFRASIIGAIPAKKKKYSKLEIALVKDSLLKLEAPDAISAIQNVRTHVNFLPITRDKNSVLAYLDSLQKTSENPLTKLALLYEKSDLGIRLKQKKGQQEVAEEIKNFRLAQEKNYSLFLSTLINDLSSPIVLKKEVKEESIKKESFPFWIFLSIALGLTAATGWVCFFLSSKKRKRTLIANNYELENKQQELKVAQDQIQYYDKAITDLRKSFESSQSDLSAHQAKESVFVDELKTQVENVVKSPDVVQIMELKNLVSRYIAKK